MIFNIVRLRYGAVCPLEPMCIIHDDDCGILCFGDKATQEFIPCEFTVDATVCTELFVIELKSQS